MYLRRVMLSAALAFAATIGNAVGTVVDRVAAATIGPRLTFRPANPWRFHTKSRRTTVAAMRRAARRRRNIRKHPRCVR